MKKVPIISVIIPAFNEEESTKETLLSLKNQKTMVPYEVIVCDNNSKDKTYSIAQEYADKVINEAMQGGVYARNTGFKHSKGKYLVHTDADTIFPDNFIEKVYKIFMTDKYVGFTCGKWNLYAGKKLSMKFKTALWNFLYTNYMKIQSIRNIVTLVGWCLCTPRKVFEKVGGFSPRNDYFEDMLYSYKIDHLGDFKYFNEINVRSSTRRLESGILNFIKYYAKKNAKISDIVRLATRKKYSKPFIIN